MTFEPIPGPLGRILGDNSADIDAEHPMESLCALTKTYGPIWKLRLGMQERVIIASHAFMQEVCDETRFSKVIASILEQVRNGLNDGLGTAYGPQEKNWGTAHRILRQHLGPMAVRDMFDDMFDIASQLKMKWARHGTGHAIEVSEDFTCSTLDTIGLCTMGYRFNSFYREKPHPFVDAIAGFLKVSFMRSRRLPAAHVLHPFENHHYWSDIELLRKLSSDIINERKRQPARTDLLNAMLYGMGTETGEQMTDDCVVNNLLTFLIVGHETTAGLLSFTFYYLLKNPSALAKARQELDEVVDSSKLTPEHLTHLPYLNAVLRESLRLSPTAATIALAANEDTIVGGKYKLKAGSPVIALLPMIHRDTDVYGEDAEEFRPERMLDSEFHRRNAQFPHCWKPFGNGIRACIGRTFAWQQALLVVSILLQNFDFILQDPLYELKVKETLTLKPEGFRMHALLRENTPVASMRTVFGSKKKERAHLKEKVSGKPLLNIYHGSNAGTCANLAGRLASHAMNYGFEVGVLATLNSAKENLSSKTPSIIITASYDGQPATDASTFVSWIRSLRANELIGVSFAIFGCGHQDWAATLHKISRYLNRIMVKRGATRLVPMGVADISNGNLLSDFKDWEDQKCWPALRDVYRTALEDTEQGSATPELQVVVRTPQTAAARRHMQSGQVERQAVLCELGHTVKRHMEIKLPLGIVYSAGDCVAILPRNPKAVIRRALDHFKLSPYSTLTLSTISSSTLPLNTPLTAIELFGAYVELSHPASYCDVRILSSATQNQETKERLSQFLHETSPERSPGSQASVLDLLELYPSISLSLEKFISMQKPMRTRQYCISSSPLATSDHISITYSTTVRQEIGSDYLSTLVPGDDIDIDLVSSPGAFHLHSQYVKVPLIMIATGLGLAPFRGFIQERAIRIASGLSQAPALLFYGCHSTGDLMYSDLLECWERLGAVVVKYAFSRSPEKSQNCKYVQDQICHHQDEVSDLLRAGAQLFFCVSGKAGKEIRQTLSEVIELTPPNALGKEMSIYNGNQCLEGAWYIWDSS